MTGQSCRSLISIINSNCISSLHIYDDEYISDDFHPTCFHSRVALSCATTEIFRLYAVFPIISDIL
ncbi:hypothetical protein Fmac_024431 [Flemingia macrophylla]|uniref:Uncharacterized protein n=1 Tax=Flemingia macrophylla TaxID=520843 RepID=A0ABD1LPG6_9FABA